MSNTGQTDQLTIWCDSVVSVYLVIAGASRANLTNSKVQATPWWPCYLSLNLLHRHVHDVAFDGSLLVAYLPEVFLRLVDLLDAGDVEANSTPRGVSPMLALTQLSNYLTLKGLFSAVSKPNFARKYAFESSRRDLHNALLCTALQSQFFVRNCQNFR